MSSNKTIRKISSDINNLLSNHNIAEIIEKFSAKAKLNPEILNECDKEGNNLLHAVYKNLDSDINYDIVELLIKCGVDVNAKNKNDETPLMYAVINSNIRNNHDTIKFLIESNSNVNDCDVNNVPPLMLACRYSNSSSSFETVKLLIDNNADVNLIDKTGWTALMLSCRYSNNVDQVKLLLDKGVDVNHKSGKWCALLLACKYSKVEIVKLLLDKNKIDNKKILNALNASYHNDDIDNTVNIISELIKYNPEYTDYNCNYILHYACKFYNKSCTSVIKLISEKIDINTSDKFGNNALITACYYAHPRFHKKPTCTTGSIETVNFLINCGADVNNVTNDHSVLMRVLEYLHNDDINIVKLLVESGANVNFVNSKGLTPLMHFIRSKRRGCSVETVMYLVSCGADVNAVTEKGWNVLMYASIFRNDENSNFAIIKYLISLGVDINLRDNRGFSALSLACKTSSHKIVKILLQSGADVNIISDRLNLLFLAISYNRKNIIKIVNMLIKYGVDVNFTSRFTKRNALMCICKTRRTRNNLQLFKTVVDSGVDINHVNTKGENIIMVAIKHGCDLQIIDYLVKSGCNTNAQDISGNTALMIACRESLSIELIKYLIDNGSDVNLVNKNGNNALMNLCINRNFVPSDNDILFDLVLKTDLHAKNSYGLTAFHYFKSNETSKGILDEYQEKIFSGEISGFTTKSARNIYSN